VYTPEERERVRADLVAAARGDPRVSGVALTGSAAAGSEDAWSDVDLAFGVDDGAGVLADMTTRLYDRHGALHHLDVMAGATVYRVFLLPTTLQVDLAFAPPAEFGARAPTFRLLSGEAADRPHVPPPAVDRLIGWGWLYALHARSSIARGRVWQAEYMVSGVRDQVLALACRRHDLPAVEGRGMDRLPADLLDRLAGALVRELSAPELGRALGVAVDGLAGEIRHARPELAARLDGALRELAG
jgi:predicted nucleotidyltransferase